MAADQSFRSALIALSQALNEIDAPSMIIGGVAVIAAGVPRETIDIDATISGKSVDVSVLVTHLERHRISPRIPDAIAFARQRQVLLLKHEPSGVTIELTFAWLPFEEEALQRSRAISFGGIALRVARPEDLIVYKAAAWRDRDRSDIERLLTLHLNEIDVDRVRGLIDQIGRALDEPTRLRSFDEMVARARG